MQIAVEFAHSNEFIEGIAHCPKCGFLATKARGAEGMRCKNPGCLLPVDSATKPRFEQQKSTRESIEDIIIPFVTGQTEIKSYVIGNKSVTILVLDFRDEPEIFSKINMMFGEETSFGSFRLPQWVWDQPIEAAREFFNGVLDSTGYANAGSWMPRDGKSGTGRMRLYVQVVRNWKIVTDYDELMRRKLGIPVQTIDWGHPNIRDSNLQEYRAKRNSAWAREHQIKFFPEYSQDLRFRLKHKQDLFDELLRHNLACGFEEDSGWFPPSRISEARRKPRHPEESDPRMPIEVRQHFDAFWQVNLALGSPSLTQLARSAASFELFALTGDIVDDSNPAIFRSGLEKKWDELASFLPPSRAPAPKTKVRSSGKGFLERDTYELLVKILSHELFEAYGVEPFVYDTSAGNLNKFVERLADEQLQELGFCENFGIRPDVVGFVPGVEEAFFIESKIEPLSLKHLGQILGYALVAVPRRAILVTTETVSESLSRSLLARPQVLTYAEGRRIEIATLSDERLEYWDPSS